MSSSFKKQQQQQQQPQPEQEYLGAEHSPDQRPLPLGRSLPMAIYIYVAMKCENNIKKNIKKKI